MRNESKIRVEELEEMCPKDKRLFVRLKKLKAIQE